MAEKENLTVLIVDDEPHARFLLRSLLEEIENVTIVGEAGTAEDALFLLVKHFPDLVFLDINLPGKSGMELAGLIRQRNIGVTVVFTSGYIDFALDAIRNQVYEFLLKPVDPDELKLIVRKYQQNKTKVIEKRLWEVLDSYHDSKPVRINSKYSFILIQPQQVLYCASEGGYTNIILLGGKKEYSISNLNVLEEQFKTKKFFRISRSVMINTNYLKRVDKYKNTCVLEAHNDKIELKVSKVNINSLLNIEI